MLEVVVRAHEDPNKKKRRKWVDMRGSIAYRQAISIGMSWTDPISMFACYTGRCISNDHGSELGAHRVREDGKWDSNFKQQLEKHGIKPILISVKHPQTNGKLERFFGEYKRHRHAFSSIDRKLFGL